MRNKLRGIQPRICGEGQPTFVIASVGSSTPADDLQVEFEKAYAAQDLGVDAVTDHSFEGDIAGFHVRLVEKLSIPVSVVTCYELAARHPDGDLSSVRPDEPAAIVEAQVRRGIDMITIHASFLKEHLGLLRGCRRIIPTTSKGGGIVSSYMRQTGLQNPYYQEFDRLLDSFVKYSVTLSLGTSFRTASVCDDWDALSEAEAQTMSTLVDRATHAGVSVMIEGVGHVAINRIPYHVGRTKQLCFGVPYRVLPMATDAALGFDHISGAIATAVCVASGADAVTCMSRAEHIGLPSLDDLREAIVATKIAVHCGEIAKLGNMDLDRRMSRTRWQSGCRGDWRAAVYPEGAKLALESRRPFEDGAIQCSMCGAHCGIKAGRQAKSEGGPG
ncbi:MAG TPA: phosphomethylpyrimidine synthase ThiC [bacterium]|nr:phosphomethylpyrimidine synthase ThiC [bacterium]